MSKVLRITARRDGFRRAGIAHSATPQVYPLDRWTPEQLAQLKAEPMLVVDEMDPPAAADDAGDKGGKAAAGKNGRSGAGTGGKV